MRTPTVYTLIAPPRGDGHETVERMALVPGLPSMSTDEAFDATMYNRRVVDFPIAFRVIARNDGRPVHIPEWRVSCLWRPRNGGEIVGDGTFGDALTWLVRGGRPPARRQNP